MIYSHLSKYVGLSCSNYTMSKFFSSFEFPRTQIIIIKLLFSKVEYCHPSEFFFLPPHLKQVGHIFSTLTMGVSTLYCHSYWYSYSINPFIKMYTFFFVKKLMNHKINLEYWWPARHCSGPLQYDAATIGIVRFRKRNP